MAEIAWTTFANGVKRMFDPFEVSSWPKFYRRIFLILFPITVPIYMFLFLIVGVLLIIAAALIGGFISVKNIWVGNSDRQKEEEEKEIEQ